MKQIFCILTIIYAFCIFADTPPQKIDKACPSHQWINSIVPGQSPTCLQPAYSDLSGSAPASAWGTIIGTLSNQTDLQTALNAKQATGNYITALTGDVTASGPGSASATLASTAVTPGSYTNSNITVDAKGRITSATNGSAGGVTSVTGTPPVVSSGGSTPAISMSVATSGANGYLSSSDWTTFNGKQGALTFNDSLINSAGTVHLVNDSATPGNSKYYGTNGSGTAGYFALPSAVPGGSSGQVQFNNAGSFSGDSGMTYSAGSGSLHLSNSLLVNGGAGSISSSGFYSGSGANFSGNLNVGGNVTAGGSLINFGQINLGGAGTGTGVSMNADATSGQADVLLNNLDGSPGFSFGYVQSGDQFFLSDNVSTQFMTIDRSTGEVNFSGDVNVNGALGVNTSLYVSGTSTLDNGAIYTDGAGDLYTNSIMANGGVTSYGGLNVASGTTQLDSGQVYTDGNGDLTVVGLTATGGLFSTTLDLSNSITNYNGDVTAGNGVVSVVKSINLTAQTATIGSTALFTPVSGGLAGLPHYEVLMDLEDSTAGTSGTVVCSVTWTSAASSVSKTFTSPTLTFGTLGARVSGFDFFVPTTAGSTYACTVTSAVGTPKFNLSIDVLRTK